MQNFLIYLTLLLCDSKNRDLIFVSREYHVPCTGQSVTLALLTPRADRAEVSRSERLTLEMLCGQPVGEVCLL